MPNTEEMIRAIARREGTARELALRFGIPPSGLRAFAAEHEEEIRAVADAQTVSSEPTPADLDSLWIANKTERLRRLQEIADISYQDIKSGGLVGAELATATREFRSYLMLAANELGQLLHRGAGDSGNDSYLSVELNGVDVENLK